VIFGQVVLSKSLDTRSETLIAFQHEIDDRALLDAAATVLPAECDVSQEIEKEERFSRLRRAPNDREANARHETFHKVIWRCRELD
jgi:hypothetical protein